MRKTYYLVLVILSCLITGCGSNEDKIIMPYSSIDYEGSEWTLETITAHFEVLGFTNFENIPIEPEDDDYDENIYVVEICTGAFNEEPWEKGEMFNCDDKIKIYYNESPLLTIDNCPELLTVLTSEDIDYKTFAEKYDGKYVEFDAHVYEHLTYHGDSGHVITVKGGDSNSNGLEIHIGSMTWGNRVNEDVQEGDLVRVSGRIDLSESEYFKMLYVEAMDMYIR